MIKTSRNLTICLIASVLTTGLAFANDQVATAANNQAATTTNANDSANTDSNESTFGRMGELDRTMEATSREIASLQMTNKLKVLQEQAQKMQLDFAIMRIYGVNGQLKATLEFNNHNSVDIQQGDKIENRYLVTKITQKQVNLYDEKAKKSLIAPFMN